MAGDKSNRNFSHYDPHDEVFDRLYDVIDEHTNVF